LKYKKPGDLAERASDFFDIPGGIATGMPRIEISGGRQIMIDQHKGLIEYSPTEISVNSSNGIIRIRGDGMEIRAMTASQLIVSGLLFGVDFEL
jgi:YabP family.